MDYYISINIHLDISEYITPLITKDEIKTILENISGVLTVRSSNFNPSTNLVVGILPSYNKKIKQILADFQREYNYHKKFLIFYGK